MTTLLYGTTFWMNRGVTLGEKLRTNIPELSHIDRERPDAACDGASTVLVV